MGMRTEGKCIDDASGDARGVELRTPEVLLECIPASSCVSERRGDSSGIDNAPRAKDFCGADALLVDDAMDQLEEGGEYGKRREDVEDQSSEAAEEP
jgi:hypothetical protein